MSTSLHLNDAVPDMQLLDDLRRDKYAARKYSVLRLVITILHVIGILQIAAAVLGAGIAIFGNISSLPIPDAAAATGAAILFCIGVAISGLLIYGFGELLQVAIDIEENTRP